MLEKIKNHMEILVNQLGISFVAFSSVFLYKQEYVYYFLAGIVLLVISNIMIGGPRKNENAFVVFFTRLFALTYETAISVLPTGMHLIATNNVKLGAIVTVSCFSCIFFFSKYELLFKHMLLKDSGEEK